MMHYSVPAGRARPHRLLDILDEDLDQIGRVLNGSWPKFYQLEAMLRQHKKSPD